MPVNDSVGPVIAEAFIGVIVAPGSNEYVRTWLLADGAYAVSSASVMASLYASLIAIFQDVVASIGVLLTVQNQATATGVCLSARIWTPTSRGQVTVTAK